MGVGYILCLDFNIGVGGGDDSADEITFGIDDESNIGSSGE